MCGMIIGALDLGSNSYHLLVARVEADGRLTRVGSFKESLKLGALVQAHGLVPPEAFRHAVETVRSMVGRAHALGAERVAAVGTSALREARNGEALVRAMGEASGVFPEIISGEMEGDLVYRGARARFWGQVERVGVIDLGGGSVEIVAGAGNTRLHVESLPLGFLRVGRMLGLDGALDESERALVTRHVDNAMREASKRLRAHAPSAWLLSGGTARALGDLVLAEPRDALSTRALGELAQKLATHDAARLRALGVDASRAEGFGLGVLLLSEVVQRLGAREVHVSPGGLREGLVLRELSQAKADSSVILPRGNLSTRMTA
jgi:exopolyphosphatase/guanosine-5'-triphosphate,3'-diphosphate pyrophosphatase